MFVFYILFVIYMFIAFIIFTFIIFTVYVFVVQLYIHQCSCYSYSILSSLFIVSHLTFCIQSLYLIFIIITYEIFHYISYSIVIVQYSLLSHTYLYTTFSLY